MNDLTAAAAPGPSERLMRRLRQTIDRPLAEALTLPPACYTEPAFHDLELRRLFAREWLCLGRADEMASPGDYLTLDVAGLPPIMAVRQKDGSIQALSRVCRHRAALLGADGGGHADLFVCPYHNWVYALDGTLRGAPAMELDPPLDRGACRLPAYRAEAWQGFVFVNLDPDAESLASRLAAVTARISSYGLDGLRTSFVVYDIWEANWKVAFENATETYHHTGVHKQTLEPFIPGLGTVCEAGDHAHNLHFAPTRGDVPLSGAQRGRMPPEAYRRLLAIGVYPTLALVFTGDVVTWFSFDPLGPVRTRVRVGWLGPPEDISDGDAERLERDRRLLETVVAEDRANCASVQRGLASPDAIEGRLSPLERTIAEFHRYLARRLEPDGPAAPER